MRRLVICIFAGGMLLSTRADSQSPQSRPVAEGPDSPPVASSPVVVNGCVYEDAQFTIGAAKCISNQLWLVCQAPDADHPTAWWDKGQQPLCQGRFDTSPAEVTQKKPPDTARRTPRVEEEKVEKNKQQRGSDTSIPGTFTSGTVSGGTPCAFDYQAGSICYYRCPSGQAAIPLGAPAIERCAMTINQ
jgi:hypothetical protein